MWWDEKKTTIAHNARGLVRGTAAKQHDIVLLAHHIYMYPIIGLTAAAFSPAVY